jgi:RNA polymerase sporulation-specific sigma factor
VVNPTLEDYSDEQLVARARTGDDIAIDTLLERYRHYARAKARTYFLAGADRDDIVQEGMIGLYKAIRDFDAGLNVVFRAFAELCIRRQIISAIKSATRQKHAPLNSYVSLNSPAHEGDDDRSFEDKLEATSKITSDPAELVVSTEEIEVLRDSMTQILSEFEIEVLGLYMDGRSYQQIANLLNRHVKSIDNALQRIKRKVERHLAHREP